MHLTPPALVAAVILAAAEVGAGDARTAGVALVAAVLYACGVWYRFVWSARLRRRPAGWVTARVAGYGAVGPPPQAATYEDLLALGEALGDVVSGLSPEQIDVFPTTVFTGDDEDAEQMSSCAVCLDYFEPGDVLRVLPCSEQFHKECIGRWLRQKPTCPLCRSRFA